MSDLDYSEGKKIETEDGKIIDVPNGYEYDGTLEVDNAKFIVDLFTDWLLRQ